MIVASSQIGTKNLYESFREHRDFRVYIVQGANREKPTKVDFRCGLQSR